MFNMFKKYEFYSIGMLHTETSWIDSQTLSLYCCSDMQTPILGQREDQKNIVYLFGCLEEGCGDGKGSWKAFRWTEYQSKGCENPSSNNNSAVNRTDESVHTEPSKGANAWGLDCEDDSFDLADLEKQLKALSEDVSTSHRKSSKKMDTCHVDNQRTSAINPQSLFDGWLPSFYLVWSADISPIKKSSVARENSDSDGVDEHDRPVGLFEGTCESMSSQRLQGEDTEDTGDAGVISWEGESYEKDAILRFTGKPADEDALFIKFMRQLSAVPDQCLRVYGEESTQESIPYLWPSKGLEKRSCTRCGSALLCIVQCMSPIISAIDESMGMIDSKASGCNVYKSPPCSWSWATLAISICSDLCIESNGGNDSFIEEYVDALGDA